VCIDEKIEIRIFGAVILKKSQLFFLSLDTEAIFFKLQQKHASKCYDYEPHGAFKYFLSVHKFYYSFKFFKHGAIGFRISYEATLNWFFMDFCGSIILIQFDDARLLAKQKIDFLNEKKYSRASCV
jgi:hypothetical protein